MPAKAYVILLAHKDQPRCTLNFDYQSVTGKLNYQSQMSRPDIMYATHQIAKYSSDPRMPHGKAIIYLIRYLMRSRNVGIRFSPNPSKGFECFCKPISLVTGTRVEQHMTHAQPNQGVVGSSSMLDVPSSGHPNCSCKWPFQQLKLNTLLCQCPFKTFF